MPENSAVTPVPDRDASEIQAYADLTPVHYREGFTMPVAGYRRPEEWLRLILEGAADEKRATMLRAWTLLGLRLAPLDSAGQVLGWRVVRSGADVAVLAAYARSGLSARIALAATPRRVTHTMVVRYDRWWGRPVWAAVAPGHRRFVQGLLQDAMRAGWSDRSASS